MDDLFNRNTLFENDAEQVEQKPKAMKKMLTVLESLTVTREKAIPFVIHQTDSIKLRWDLLIMILAVFNCITIPFKVAFKPPSMDTKEFRSSNSIIDCVFLLDILVSFRTATISIEGKEITTPREIASHYLKGQFWIDLLATIPFDLLASSMF